MFCFFHFFYTTFNVLRVMWFKLVGVSQNGMAVCPIALWPKSRSYCVLTDYCLCVEPAGTRNAILNTEARTVEAEVLSRRCVIMRLVDFSYEEYQKALRQSAGAVVIILPKNMSAVPQDIVQVRTAHCFMTTVYPINIFSGLFLQENNIFLFILCSSSWNWSQRCWLLRPSSPSTLPWRTMSCCPYILKPWPLPPRKGPCQQLKVEMYRL